MKRVLKSGLLVAATMLIAANTTLAADLPDEALEPVAAPVEQPSGFDWSGFYIGANAGIDFNGSFDNNFATNLDKGIGFIGGGVAGYNFQFDKYVLGLEGDFNYLGGEATSGAATADLDFLGTLTARAGYTPFERILTYVEGGLAVGRADIQLAGASDQNIAAGFVLGAGTEYAITDKLITGVEYNYVNLQNRSFDLGAGSTSADYDSHQVKFNLKYKF